MAVPRLAPAIFLVKEVLTTCAAVLRGRSQHVLLGTGPSACLHTHGPVFPFEWSCRLHEPTTQLWPSGFSLATTISMQSGNTF